MTPLLLTSAVTAGIVHGARVPQEGFEIQEVATGVFVARPGESSLAGANATFIVNESDIVVVDTHMTPGAARQLVADIGKLSTLPVRFVVHSHWHPDHTQGSQSYVAAYPQPVRILSHRVAREEMQTLGVARLKRDLERLPREIAELEQRLELDPANAASIGPVLSSQRRFLQELTSVRLVLPELTFETAMTLSRGSRNIQLLYFGKGHTAGDTVVYIPQERVAIVGDLITGGPPFARDGFPLEWIATLRAVNQLDVTRVISGHGAVRGKEVLGQRIAFLEDAMRVIEAGRHEGLSAERIAAGIDLDSYRASFDPEPTHKPWRSWMRMIVDRVLEQSN